MLKAESGDILHDDVLRIIFAAALNKAASEHKSLYQ
jgi:hypothetical protein